MVLTSLPRSIAVLDTNACRDLGADLDRFAELRKWEHANGVQGFAHPTVAWEILARLGDSRATAGRENWVAAAQVLYGHGQSQFGRGRAFCYLLDPETELCRVLFDHVPDGHLETTERIFGLLQAIEGNQATVEEPEANKMLSALFTMSEELEQQWVDDVWRFAVKSQVPHAKSGDWHAYRDDPDLRDRALAWIRSDESVPVLGLGLVLRAANQLPESEGRSDHSDRARWVAGNYTVSLRLYAEIIGRIVSTGCDLRKPHRRNWVWDLQIALAVGQNHSYRGRRMRLVTSDKDIVRAAQSAGAGDYVLPLDAYESLLKKGRVGG